MSQHSSPDNVPSATRGTADSLAAPGRVGAGGTKNPARKSGWGELKEVVGMMIRSPIFWSLIPFNAAIVVLANWQHVMTWWAKDTPFAVVEDWSEFLAFVLVYSLGNLVEGLTNFFRAVFA